mmetsp:Transcript_14083/g.59600  ORF Transcript_14083/g.59600 Transcript_14083/m.59600 type:complete len:256 (+) Transcript_14083:721-1488(+)
MIHEIEVTLHALRVIEELLRDVRREHQKSSRRVVVLGRVLPKQCLAHPMTFTLGTRVLKSSVHHIRLDTDLLVHPLDEVGVPTRKHADGKDAHLQLAVISRDDVFIILHGRSSAAPVQIIEHVLIPHLVIPLQHIHPLLCELLRGVAKQHDADVSSRVRLPWIFESLTLRGVGQVIARRQHVCVGVLGHVRERITQPHGVHVGHENVEAHLREQMDQLNLLATHLVEVRRAPTKVLRREPALHGKRGHLVVDELF